MNKKTWPKHDISKHVLFWIACQRVRMLSSQLCFLGMICNEERARNGQEWCVTSGKHSLFIGGDDGNSFHQWHILVPPPIAIGITIQPHPYFSVCFSQWPDINHPAATQWPGIFLSEFFSDRPIPAPGDATHWSIRLRPGLLTSPVHGGMDLK